MASRRCTGVLLAGGTASRFGGTHKGLLTLGDRRIMDYGLAALAGAADEVIVIANDPRVREALDNCAPVYADAGEQRGSLVGLRSALSHASDGALVIGWDMPFLSSAVLRELRRIGEASATAAIPEGPRGPEPLCAYYPRWCLDIVEQQLARRELRLGALVEALPARVLVPLEEVARFGPPDRLFTNINAPVDLEAAMRSMPESLRPVARDL